MGFSKIFGMMGWCSLKSDTSINTIYLPSALQEDGMGQAWGRGRVGQVVADRPSGEKYLQCLILFTEYKVLALLILVKRLKKACNVIIY